MNYFQDEIMIISLFCISTDTYSQNKYLTESETHIFWQSSRKLLINDFQGGNPTETKFDRDRKLGRSVIPCLGIFLQVDIPKNYRSNKLEKVYFAPAFQKSCSFILDKDTSNFRDAQIQFDIYELATRIARKYIWDMHAYMAIQSDSSLIDVINNNPDTILITGIGNILAAKARDSALSLASKMTYAYFKDQYLSVDSTSASYEEWRALVDNGLKNHERYATKPEDCYRMVNDKPILKNYKSVK